MADEFLKPPPSMSPEEARAIAARSEALVAASNELTRAVREKLDELTARLHPPGASDGEWSVVAFSTLAGLAAQAMVRMIPGFRPDGLDDERVRMCSDLLRVDVGRAVAAGLTGLAPEVQATAAEVIAATFRGSMHAAICTAISFSKWMFNPSPTLMSSAVLEARRHRGVVTTAETFDTARFNDVTLEIAIELPAACEHPEHHAQVADDIQRDGLPFVPKEMVQIVEARVVESGRILVRMRCGDPGVYLQMRQRFEELRRMVAQALARQGAAGADAPGGRVVDANELAGMRPKGSA